MTTEISSERASSPAARKEAPAFVSRDSKAVEVDLNTVIQLSKIFLIVVRLCYGRIPQEPKKRNLFGVLGYA